MRTRPDEPPATPLHTLQGWVADLAGRTPELRPGAGPAPDVTGLTLSSQRVEPGDLYAALPGARAHGIGYAADAVAAGAVAVLTDPAGAADPRCPDGVPVLVVEHPRSVLGALAARVQGSPAASLRMVGVTGTQGKTTTTRLAEGALGATGVRAGVIGTVGTRVAGQDLATSLTTPEAPDLQALLAVMREQQVEVCAMEVSSHALVMGRVDGVVFDVAVFLNLGRDHLDFHADVEDYYRAKASLFTPERARLALVNVDDAHGRRLAGETALPVRTFSTRGSAADWTARAVTATEDGWTFEVGCPDGTVVPARLALPGRFNVENALAALAACGEVGYDVGTVAATLARAVVPGRMEPVGAGHREDPTVVVDYAHKPDAVEAAVAALRPVAEEAGGRVVVVIGAGGDRDRGKRPLMGEIAARLADVLVVTDDNPRTEDPAAIRAEVLGGVRTRSGLEVREVGDRRRAIADAVAQAGPADVVLVAGKGHETGQEVDGVVHPFDDRVVAREALEARAAAPTGPGGPEGPVAPR